MNLRDKILGSADAQLLGVHVWGCDLHIRKFSLGGRNKVYRTWKDAPEMVAAVIIANSLCDEHGKLLFGDKDLDKLLEKDGEAADALVEQIKEFNGLNKAEDQAELKN
jgi:hypothetical protein